jgi:hypothetical protein
MGNLLGWMLLREALKSVFSYSSTGGKGFRQIMSQEAG